MPNQTRTDTCRISHSKYDGYYDTVQPTDADADKAQLDKERIKKAILVLCLGAVFITACIVFMK